MRVLFLLFIITNIFAKEIAVKGGDYRCVVGNSVDICSQKIIPHYFDEILTGITVGYIGDCLGQGSNLFACQNGVCQSGTQTISITDETHYSWKNEMFDFFCDFEILFL